MCNTCNHYMQCGRCGYTNGYGHSNGCSWNTQSICRDCCGNIWVRVANGNTQTNVCQCSCACQCGYSNAATNTNTNSNTNGVMGTYCVDGNAYYARQYALNGNTRSCGCGYNN